ncbi:4128_t:CDS:2, partial [Racocetra fulgida]
FYIGHISQRWYTNLTVDSTLANKSTIVSILNEDYSTLENNEQIKFSHLERFRIMKKALTLAISIGRVEEFYEMHSSLVNEMENEIAKNKHQTIEQGDDLSKFAHTISNPIGIKMKRRKSKREKAFNNITNIKDQRKKKKRSADSDNEDLII